MTVKIAAKRPRLHNLLPPAGVARPLAVTVFVQTIGLGLLTALSAIYLTRFVGLSVAEVGLGLTAAAGLGLVVGVPVGHLADRCGPRGLLIGLLCLVAVAVLGYLLIDSLVSFLVVVGLYQLADRAANAVRGAVIAKAVPADEQVSTRGHLRAVSNIGFAVGAVLAGWSLTADTIQAFQGLIVAAAAGYVIAAVALARVPPLPPIPRERGASPGTAVRDLSYLGFAVINAVLTFHYAVLEIGMPLWVLQHTDAPRWMVTVLFVVNTLMVTGLQVMVGRRADTVSTAKRATLVADLLLAASCALFGMSALTGTWLVIAMLVAAGVLHALGEMYQVAAAWLLAFELAPANAHGQYQGLFSTSTSAGLMAGASVVALLAVNGGLVGWLALGAIFLVASAAMSPVVQRNTTATA